MGLHKLQFYALKHLLNIQRFSEGLKDQENSSFLLEVKKLLLEHSIKMMETQTNWISAKKLTFITKTYLMMVWVRDPLSISSFPLKVTNTTVRRKVSNYHPLFKLIIIIKSHLQVISHNLNLMCHMIRRHKNS